MRIRRFALFVGRDRLFTQVFESIALTAVEFAVLRGDGLNGMGQLRLPELTGSDRPIEHDRLEIGSALREGFVQSGGVLNIDQFLSAQFLIGGVQLLSQIEIRFHDILIFLQSRKE